MRIRAATLDDAAEIARLCTLLAYPVDAATMTVRLRQLLGSPTQPVWVATINDDSRLAGLIAAELRMLLEFGTRGEIVALVVDGDARRTGLGRTLVDTACDWIREQGGDDVFVRSNVLRPEAHAFYPNAGFERAKTQHVYVKRLEPNPR